MSQHALPGIDPVAELRAAVREIVDHADSQGLLAEAIGMNSAGLCNALAGRRGRKLDLLQVHGLLVDNGAPRPKARKLVAVLASWIGCELVSVLQPDAEDIAAVLPEVCARNGGAGEAVLAQIHEAARGNARRRTLRARPRRRPGSLERTLGRFVDKESA